MMENRFGRSVLDAKAFLLMLVFGFVGSGLILFRLGFQVYGHLSAVESATFGVLMNGYAFLVNPVLAFVMFYRFCGRSFMEKAASTLISVVLGAVVGAVIGWLIVGGVVASTLGFPLLSSLSLISQGLQSSVVGNTLLALAAVAFATMVRRWDEKLLGSGQRLTVERPFEVSVASVVYVLSGVLVLCVSPLLLVLQEASESYSALFVSVVVLVVIGGFVELLIGYGVYKGRRWGWLVAFGGSLIGLVINASTLILLAFEEANWSQIPVAEAVSASMALLLDLVVIWLLLPLRSRLYCRMVDPPVSS